MSGADRKSVYSDKRGKYVGLLDDALCHGNWAEVPELTRKVEKHTPERSCLVLMARSEAKIAGASNHPNSSTSLASLVELAPKLEGAITAGNNIEEDVYMASVTLAQVYWLGKKYESALRVLPEYEPSPNARGGLASALGWLEVCSVKIQYIRISALAALGQDNYIPEAFQKAIKLSTSSRTPELRRWTERLLVGVCLYFSDQAIQSQSLPALSEALRAFWAWNDFWQRSSTQDRSGSNSAPDALRRDVPRRQVWKRYYDLLSTILQRKLVYNLSAVSNSDLLLSTSEDSPGERVTEARKNQWREFSRVETTYESILLNETKFPKATEDNKEVEDWTEQVLRNWEILCGSRWTDAEVGDGGKAAIGRGVLDILYRAATKTFHSTAILRQLFTVHSALGEFDLAMHAFDSYVDIVGKAKARAEKSGKHELGFDDDDVAIRTSAEAVRILCRYGGPAKAEKALQVGRTIEVWLAQPLPTANQHFEGTSDDNRATSSKVVPPQNTEALLKPSTLAAAYRAIGQSQAQWARFTYAADTRGGLQEQAGGNLKRAEALDPESIETAYASGLLLADTRDATSAIAVLRSILAVGSSDDSLSGEDQDYTRERKLIPIWHLLALCLTAKDQHESALKMCEAAFEQFGDPIVLFGQKNPDSNSDPEKQSAHVTGGVVDQMEALERESIIQLGMTQLAFVELQEGPAAAVDQSDELLALFTRLFGKFNEGRPKPEPPKTPTFRAPSRTGTLRSIAGSIRHRGQNLEKISERQAASGVAGQRSVNGAVQSSPTAKSGGSPISITVTGEDGQGKRDIRHRFSRRPQHEGDSNQSSFPRRSVSLLRKGRPSSSGEPAVALTSDTAQYLNGNGKAVEPAVVASLQSDAVESPQQDIKVDHNAAHDHWPPPAGHEDEPPQQDVRLPTQHPAVASTPTPRFSSMQQRRHKLGLLVKVWLFIAQLYLRAEMLEDASGAIVEANKLVVSMEAEVAVNDSSAKEFSTAGWGGAKSVDELRAEILSADGDLAVAHNWPHAAIEKYERALDYWPDHSESIISLAGILMDIYEEKIPGEEWKPLLPPLPAAAASSLLNTDGEVAPQDTNAAFNAAAAVPQPRALDKDPSPASMNRLAARDRAYMLVSNLTRLGSGWDNSEAWYTLARAHELSKQVQKAKQALWWVVELEDNKPIRSWRDANAGGFTL